MARSVETFEQFVETLSPGGMMNSSLEIPDDNHKSRDQDEPLRMADNEGFLKGMTAERAQRWLDAGLPKPKEDKPLLRDRFPLEVAVPKPESTHRLISLLRKVPGLRPVLSRLQRAS